MTLQYRTHFKVGQHLDHIIINGENITSYKYTTQNSGCVFMVVLEVLSSSKTKFI